MRQIKNYRVPPNLLFVATLFFIEGALRRGLTLQEDSDATI
ncbi:hypothetical protein [Rothia sp. P4278]